MKYWAVIKDNKYFTANGCWTDNVNFKPTADEKGGGQKGELECIKWRP